jgi:hypothetical protein
MPTPPVDPNTNPLANQMAYKHSIPHHEEMTPTSDAPAKSTSAAGATELKPVQVTKGRGVWIGYQNNPGMGTFDSIESRVM